MGQTVRELSIVGTCSEGITDDVVCVVDIRVQGGSDGGRRREEVLRSHGRIRCDVRRQRPICAGH